MPFESGTSNLEIIDCDVGIFVRVALINLQEELDVSFTIYFDVEWGGWVPLLVSNIEEEDSSLVYISGNSFGLGRIEGLILYSGGEERRKCVWDCVVEGGRWYLLLGLDINY